MINLDLKNVSDLINSPIGYAVLFFIYTLLIIFLGYSFVDYDKGSICSNELIAIESQTTLINELEAELGSCISKGETDCIEREQRICRQEKEDIKKNCNLLLEQIEKGLKK
tara:strand:- start:37 stop:369 length:333 start_codon:yes stop_codon:yes gene_type:complete